MQAEVIAVLLRSRQICKGDCQWPPVERLQITQLTNCAGHSSHPLLDSEQRSVYMLVAGNLTSISQTVPGSQPGQENRTISLWTSPDRIQNFAWALHSAVSILPKYEILFDYPYFLPKLDIVAMPDFVFQAMENWGLLYYDQQRIEIAPGTSPLSYRYGPSMEITTCFSIAHLFKRCSTASGNHFLFYAREGFAIAIITVTEQPPCTKLSYQSCRIKASCGVVNQEQACDRGGCMQVLSCG